MASSAARQLGAAIRRNGAAVRQPLGVVPLRSAGLGMPTGKYKPPSAPVHEEHELIWDGGDGLPEPMFPKGGGEGPISQYECLAWLCGGLGLFAAVGLLAKWRNDMKKPLYPPREYPWLEEWDLLKPKGKETAYPRGL